MICEPHGSLQRKRGDMAHGKTNTTPAEMMSVEREGGTNHTNHRGKALQHTREYMKQTSVCTGWKQIISNFIIVKDNFYIVLSIKPTRL